MKKIKLTIVAFIIAIIGGWFYWQNTPEQQELVKMEKILQLQNEGKSEQSEKMYDSLLPEQVWLLAEKNNPMAQFFMGKIYAERKQREKAMQWFQKAADQNLPAAYRELAGLDRKQKIAHFTKAASLGDVPAKLYLVEEAVQKSDYLTAFMQLKELANMGIPMAQAAVAEYYFEGGGVKADWEKAFEWYHKAYNEAKKRNESAIFRKMRKASSSPNDVYRDLAILYLLGIGTEKNEQKAVELLAERNLHREDDAIDIDKLKLMIVALVDIMPDQKGKIQAKIAQFEKDVRLNADAEMLILLGNKQTNQSKAKSYFGDACEKGSQEGCDKYRELNEKGVE